MSKVVIAPIFGGRSVEHEVSVITAHEVMAALPRDKFDIVPIYVSKDGRWHTGDALLDLSRFAAIDSLIKDVREVSPAVSVGTGGLLRTVGSSSGFFGRSSGESIAFDVAFPLIHGSHGEDGTLQGLLELANIPYVGCGVTAAALSMDKPLSRAVFKAAGLPVLNDMVIERRQWRENSATVAAAILARGLPVYVKPATLGSSIGVARAGDQDELINALDVAFAYDARIVVEPAQDDIVEINCSVLGMGPEVVASVCEQPTKSGLLSYADKYAGGGKGGGAKARGTKRKPRETAAGMASGDRIIPAPISEALTARIQAAARAAFMAIGAAGVARVDFIVRPENDWFVVNELNSIPGALAFYLWEPSGIAFSELLERLIQQAIQRASEKAKSSFSMDDWLLRGAAQGGTKKAG